MKIHHSIFLVPCSLLLFSCSVSKNISSQANKFLVNDSAIRTGHIGISIYEPATGKYWYNYNADKYFIPASNTKLFTLYGGMKYLGDSLVGLRYTKFRDTIYALPTGDPTFLHPDFEKQPVEVFLSTQKDPILFSNEVWKAEKYGSGWAWDDYNDSYMAERNALPIYGNVMNLGLSNNDLSIPLLRNTKATFNYDTTLGKPYARRALDENRFDISLTTGKNELQRAFPFVTNGIKTSLQILHERYPWITSTDSRLPIADSRFTSLHSQPTDSLFAPMMHNSDNFFAEQTLLMVSNEKLGYMSDEDIIDTLLRTDLSQVPQKPKWIDGSGLSRYNLFTPESFVYILDKMKNEFGLERLKVILPTGGEGTLKNYLKKDSSFIYAKTGTLSNNQAMSGFLYTQKGKLLIFPLLANNYNTGAAPVRNAMVLFLEEIRKKY